MSPEIQEKLSQIFHPIATRQLAKHKKNGFRFAHYTSADSAISIIKSGQLWLRSTACMSDYREVAHGQEQLDKYFSNSVNDTRFRSVMEKCSPGSAQRAIDAYRNWWVSTKNRTFIACLTEHSGSEWDESHREDQFGRLSMWRAFGNGPNVAIVIDGNKIGDISGLNAVLSPVAYHDEAETNAAIQEILEGIEANVDFIRSIPAEWVTGSLFNSFFYAVLCLKHPAFREEREWRVIYSPDRNRSHLIESETRSINGVPQMVHKIPIALPDYLDRVLIGPTQYESSIQDALIMELSKIKVPNASMKVHPTRIPIRTSN